MRLTTADGQRVSQNSRSQSTIIISDVVSISRRGSGNVVTTNVYPLALFRRPLKYYYILFVSFSVPAHRVSGDNNDCKFVFRVPLDFRSSRHFHQASACFIVIIVEHVRRSTLYYIIIIHCQRNFKLQ